MKCLLCTKGVWKGKPCPQCKGTGQIPNRPRGYEE